MLDPMLEYGLRDAQAQRDYALKNQALDMQRQAQNDAARAATVSGIAQTGGLLATGLLTNKALNNQAANNDMMKQYLLGQGAGSGGVQLPAGVGSGALTPPGALQAPGYTAPMLQTPTTFPAATMEAGAPAATAGMSTTAAIGNVGSAFAAQYASGKMLQKPMENAGMKYTNMGWTYAGLPGAVTGATVDVIKGLGSFASDVFGW